MSNRARVYRQGHLDGLCGLYALVHAVERLAGPCFHRHSIPEDIFRAAARGLPSKLYPNVLWDGTSPSDLLKAAQNACGWFEKNTGVGLDVSRPFLRKRFGSRDEFLDGVHLLRENGPGREFIVWIDWAKKDGGGSHWSLYSGVSDTHIKLIDSDGTAKLVTNRLAVSGDRGVRIDPRWTIMVEFSRLHGEPQI